MKTKIFLALILTTFIFNSCQKDELEQVLNNESDQNIALAPKGFENPFTYVGTFHVQFLNDMTNDPDFPDLDEEGIIDNITVSLGASGLLDPTVPPTDFMSNLLAAGIQDELTTIMDNDFDLDYMLAGPDRYFSEGSITSKQRDRLNTLFNIVKTSQSNEMLATRLSTFDNNLNVRQDISGTEKELVFMVSAITRSTGDFIETVQGDPNNPWHPILEDKGWCFFCLLFDALGAAAGAAAGGVGGAVAVGGILSAVVYIYAYEEE